MEEKKRYKVYASFEIEAECEEDILFWVEVARFDNSFVENPEVKTIQEVECAETMSIKGDE